jgi:hypothetical protein
MRQEFHKGDNVEVWIDGVWEPALVDTVWRCGSIPDGKRSYMYTLIYDGRSNRPPIDAEFTVRVDQADIRKPGQRKHTEQNFGPVRQRKQPRPLRAHRYQ